MKKPLGCLSRAGIATAVLTLLLLGGALLVWGGRPFSPGPLAARSGTEPLGGVGSHADIGGRCSACHTAPWAGDRMSNRCLACHTAISAQMQDPASLHGTLQARESGPCYACHPEHRGAGAPLTVIDPLTFPHQATGFSLEGHARTESGTPFNCADCHGDDLGRFDPARCAACHDGLDAGFNKAHRAAFGEGCRACHDGVDRYGDQFDHDESDLPLLGRHAAAGCAACHAGAHSPGDLEAAPTACIACHRGDDTHEGGLGEECARCHSPEAWEQATFDHGQTSFDLIGRHASVECGGCHGDNVYSGTASACFACHAKDDAHQGGLGQECGQCHTPEGWDQATFDHGQTSFALTGRHLTVECDGCHAEGVYRGLPVACFACHEADDDHQGGLGQECAECHTPAGWNLATFDHSQTSFALTGRHLTVECNGCHAEGVYRGLPAACFACHETDDVHEGQLGQECAECHTSEGWEQVTFDHSRSRFSLTGQHAGAACSDCHAGGVFRGTPTRCFACHRDDDAHSGQFGQDCAACHTADGWERTTFDHGRAAFALTGAHLRVGCLDCHSGGVFRGSPQVCSGCHEDPAFHQSLFGTVCVDCHTADGWAPARYDRSHGFPLAHGRPGASPCRTCHPDSLASYSCYSCHEHNPAEIESKHRDEGIDDTPNCVSCHPAGQKEEGGD